MLSAENLTDKHWFSSEFCTCCSLTVFTELVLSEAMLFNRIPKFLDTHLQHQAVLLLKENYNLNQNRIFLCVQFLKPTVKPKPQFGNGTIYWLCILYLILSSWGKCFKIVLGIGVTWLFLCFTAGIYDLLSLGFIYLLCWKVPR